MQFKLTIKIGNDVVQTWPDIAYLLRHVANDIADNNSGMADTSRRIRDANGNSVGFWEIES